MLTIEDIQNITARYSKALKNSDSLEYRDVFELEGAGNALRLAAPMMGRLIVLMSLKNYDFVAQCLEEVQHGKD